MKKGFILAAIIMFSMKVFAQQDTVAYANQRVKVNTLLAERSAKFGQYDQSLTQRTGIFGWQTRKDIKNSNEILRQVVLTDNNIFKELKVLMDFKDLQNQQKVEVADHSIERLDNYMRTIKNLQEENAHLKQIQVTQNKGGSLSTYIIMFLILVMVGGFYFLNKKIKKDEKSIV
ncbi:hypothetical protein [Pedobacter mucosus]|uniref:hypothetical protein n=1 Tax=Pedobacter mucosus TaxID=2895286 RepID=UPI001EE4A904|nr:hypothetical protein [Pedobacter mucosus]UKT65743.1 hypothetical protein LOK61_08105 [Pedobacter mucosus]